MSGDGEEEILCMIDDGAGETGVLLLLRDGALCRITADPKGSEIVRLACATLDGLLRGGVPWGALVTLGADSPRSAFAIEQIAAFLEARGLRNEFDENHRKTFAENRGDPAHHQGETP